MEWLSVGIVDRSRDDAEARQNRGMVDQSHDDAEVWRIGATTT
jgi:hypothetical protein